MGRSLAATVLTTLTDLQSLSPQVYRIIYPKQRKQKLASLLELDRNRSQRVTLSDISRGTTTTQNNMIGVMTLHPAQRNMMMERFPCWPGDDSDMMESVMDMMEGWNNAPRMMGPRGWSTPRVRCCPYGATPVWRSRGNCLPLLLNDLTSVLAPASDVTKSTKNTDQLTKNNDTRRHGNTHSGVNKSPLVVATTRVKKSPLVVATTRVKKSPLVVALSVAAVRTQEDVRTPQLVRTVTRTRVT